MATQIFASNIYNYGSSSSLRATITYDKRRDGANMQYKFYYRLETANRDGTHSSGAYYSNNLKTTFNLNGSSIWTKNIQNSTAGWSVYNETDWITVSNKTSGTTPFNFTIKDTTNTSWCNYTSSNIYLAIDPAGSELKTISNFNIGDTLTIQSTKFNNDFYDVLQIKIGTTLIKEIEEATTEETITFNNTELSTIYGLMASDISKQFTFIMSSYSNNTKSTLISSSTKNATGTLTDYLPVISNITYQANNTQSITHDNQIVIGNYSDVVITCNFELKKGATLTKIYLNDGTEFTVSGNTATATVNLDYDNFVIYIQDSRTTNYNGISIANKFITYTELTLSASFSRNEPTDNKVKIDFSGNVYNNQFGASGEQNTLTISYRYKKTTEEEYSNWIIITPTLFNNTFSGNYLTDELIDYRYEYNIQLQAADLLHSGNNSIIINGNTIPKGIPVFNWGEDFFNVNGDIQSNGVSIINNSFVLSEKKDTQVTLSNQNEKNFNISLSDDMNNYKYLLIEFGDKFNSTYYMDSILVSKEIYTSSNIRKSIFLAYFQRYVQIQKVNNTELKITFNNTTNLNTTITIQTKVTGIK